MRLVKRLFLLFSAAAFALSLSAYLNASDGRTREVSSLSPSSGGSSQGYCLRSEGDRLYVLPLAGGEAMCVGGVRISDLPEEDRRQLAAGLTVPDDESLLALLEDYTG